MLAFDNEIQQKQVYGHILSGKLSSKDVEQMASATKGRKVSATKEDKKFTELEKNLAEMLKTPVLIKSADNGGRIIIKFATLQELNKIAKAIID